MLQKHIYFSPITTSPIIIYVRIAIENLILLSDVLRQFGVCIIVDNAVPQRAQKRLPNSISCIKISHLLFSSPRKISSSLLPRGYQVQLEESPTISDKDTYLPTLMLISSSALFYQQDNENYQILQNQNFIIDILQLFCIQLLFCK